MAASASAKASSNGSALWPTVTLPPATGGSYPSYYVPIAKDPGPTNVGIFSSTAGFVANCAAGQAGFGPRYFAGISAPAFNGTASGTATNAIQLVGVATACQSTATCANCSIAGGIVPPAGGVTAPTVLVDSNLFVCYDNYEQIVMAVAAQNFSSVVVCWGFAG